MMRSSSDSSSRRRRAIGRDGRHSSSSSSSLFVPTLDTIPSSRPMDVMSTTSQLSSSSQVPRQRRNQPLFSSSSNSNSRRTPTTTSKISRKSDQKKQQTTTTKKKKKNVQNETKTKNNKNKKVVTTTTRRKYYRRTKRLRPCVPKAIFFIPLVVLLLEWYIGRIIQLDDAQTFVYDQMLGIDPYDIRTARATTTATTTTTAALSELSPFPTTTTTTTTSTLPSSIMNVTFTPRYKCIDKDHKRILNVHNPYAHYTNSDVYNPHSIPNVVHQHGPTRCLSRIIDRAAIQWIFHNDAGGNKNDKHGYLWSYAYYYWDDDAIQRLVSSLDLLRHDFPLLASAIRMTRCYDHYYYNNNNNNNRTTTETTSSTGGGDDNDNDNSTIHLKDGDSISHTIIESLWQFIVLWIYGGYYVDLNYFPTGFNITSTVYEHDHGIFFVDDDDVDQQQQQQQTNANSGNDQSDNDKKSKPKPILTTRFMGVSSHHPIIYFTIQRMIQWILLSSVEDDLVVGKGGTTITTTVSNINNIGQYALNMAWNDLKQQQQQQKGYGSKDRKRKQRRKGLFRNGHKNEQEHSDGGGEYDDYSLGNFDRSMLFRIVGGVGKDRTEWISPVFRTELGFEREYMNLRKQKQHLQQQQQQSDNPSESSSSSSKGNLDDMGGTMERCRLQSLLHSASMNLNRNGNNKPRV